MTPTDPGPVPPGPTRPPFVVKLGGSVITRKREALRMRPKVLLRLAGEIARADAGPGVLLHGAGSFGHPGAVRFGLAGPPRAGAVPTHRLRGAAIVATEVRRLHLAVLQALVRSGANPVSVPPSTLARNREGSLVWMDDRPFRAALATGGLPVSFGDVVPDERWGWSILSADTIAEELARRLPAGRVLFVSDVPGVLQRDSAGRSRVAESLTEEVVRSLRPAPGAPDVTGGIRAKAETMQRIAAGGVDAGLISGLRDGALSRALRGEAVYGSWCRPPR